MTAHITSPSFPNGLDGLRSETEARGNITMLDVIRRGASKPKPEYLPCPFCGTDPPLAAAVCGRWVIACEAEHCTVDVQASGATVTEAWAKWNKRS